MSGPLATILERVDAAVKERLTAAGYPPLAEGKILFGRVEQYAAGVAPRILFTPTGSKFSMRDIYSSQPSADQSQRKQQASQRAIEQEAFGFEVRCWGADPTSDDLVDHYDITRALYHATRAAIQSVAPGSYSMSDSGTWTTSSFSSPQMVALGAEFTFSVSFLTPVLASLLPYDRARQNAPSNVTAAISDSMTLPDGSTEAGCEAP